MIFKRKIYNELLDWKKKYNGTYAVLIRGARRVGKSTIVEEFAKKEYKSYIKIDFSDLTKEMTSVFEDIANRDLFFLRLQAETKVTLYERESVIIFDEVQLFPKARQAIKHLVKDHRYDYIETGSLISIRKNIKDIVIPSEELSIDMNPMDYDEFNWAIGNETIDIVEQLIKAKKGLGDSINQKLMRDFRIYMAVGGMPQAVEAYINKKSFMEIDEVKRGIIKLYKEDFNKIDKSGRIGQIFEDIPAQLALNKKRFFITHAIGKKKSTKDEERLSDLIDSKAINICYNVSNPSNSFSQSKIYNEYKLYLADTGLFTTLLFNDESKVNEDIYKKLLSDKLSENLGYLYENVVSQILVANGKSLYYHTWQKENSTHSYEVDFLIHKDNKIVPIEVKSSRIRPHESLDAIGKKYSKKIASKWILSQRDIGKIDDIELWPIYCLPKLL